MSSDFTLYKLSKFTQTANVYDTLTEKAIWKATKRTQTVPFIVPSSTSFRWMVGEEMRFPQELVFPSVKFVQTPRFTDIRWWDMQEYAS